MNELWNQLALRAGLVLSEEQHGLLNRYLDELLEMNKVMNLTRITERAAAELQHVADSLTVLRFLPAGGHRLADVGSGGGVPGFPLAIARPDAQVTLIESTQKKAAFLKRTAETLGLKNVTVMPERAEKLPKGTFDVVVARALADLDTLAGWCMPLARKGGKVLALKGPKVVEELPAAAQTLKRFGASAPVVHAVEVAGLENHVIVEIGK